ncbi:hypothetical protein TL16_g11331 [Triparma laevis f. inornata]|uniref:Tyrosine-protein kinase ephrin type A/B receptor-like domain-containing protein n=1 Tax=Triparma laevis f. inornata TaxID=1714386 RepID=A0A9W7ERL1_9STRA|nr:hypothetical protein TL16_g11331 [Triparma laevis f. inornata]
MRTLLPAEGATWECLDGITGEWGEPCPSGKYCIEDDTLGFNTCCACEIGSYCVGHILTRYSFGDGNCWGSNQAGDNAPMTPCPAGKFNTAKSMSTCGFCEAGKATPVPEGATECSICDLGMYHEANDGTAHCHFCAEGKYAPEASSSSCTDCDAGKYAPDEGRISCVDCPAGSNSPAGSYFCNLCDKGEYGFYNSEVDKGCLACQPGKYNVVPGLNCVNCAAGTYIGVNATDSTLHDEEADCLPCPAGKQVTSTGALDCNQCGAGSYKEAASDLPCNLCKAGKASKKVGSVSQDDCRKCDNSLVQYDDLEDKGLTSCKTINCKKGEYLSDQGCRECNIIFSVCVCVGGAALLLFACVYVEKVATERMKLLQLKILSTFFQTSELTTHINIQWPKIAFLSLPFSMPMSDATCLTPLFWDSRWSFLLFIYVPLMFFLFLYFKWRKLPIGSSREKKLQQLGVFLLMLWYSPVLLAAASMYDCVEDVENGGGWFLRADTSTPCQYKKKEVSMEYIKSLDYIDWHAFVVGMFIGLGFPSYIFVTLRRHRRKGKLNASSPYTALFEWYIPSQCTFETAQMMRKALLILAGGIPFSRLRPMIKEPSRIFKRLNLFSTAEGMSILITICGNFLALFGTFYNKQAYNIGLVFAYMNFSFATIFLIVFAVEIRRSTVNIGFNERSASGVQGGKMKLSRGLTSAMKNWKMHHETMERHMQDEDIDDFTKTQLLKESNLILNRVRVEVRDELVIKEEKLAASFSDMNALEEDIGYASLRLRNEGYTGDESLSHSKVKKLIKKLENKEKKHKAMVSGADVQSWLDGLIWVFDKMKSDENWEKQWKSRQEAGRSSKNLLRVIGEEDQMVHILKLLEGEVIQTSKRKLEMVDLSRRNLEAAALGESDTTVESAKTVETVEEETDEEMGRERDSSTGSSYFEGINPMKVLGPARGKKQWDLSGSARHLVNSVTGEKKPIGTPSGGASGGGGEPPARGGKKQ